MNIKKLLLSYLFFTISAFTITLSIKASIGVSSFNALNIAIANAVSIKIGTITTGFNILFLLTYMYLTKFSFKKKYFAQAISVMLFGILINFFNYNLLKDLVINNYILKVITMSLGTILGGFSIGMIVSLNTITFPLESLCVVLGEKTKFTFVQLRYFVDIISVIISITISLNNNLPLYVREGTIISLLLLSVSMNFTKNRYENYIIRKESVMTHVKCSHSS